MRHTCAIKDNSILRIKKVDIYTSVHGIKTMFGSSFPPVVCRRVHVLFTLFVFVCAWWFQHILCCAFVLFFSCVHFITSFSRLSC